MVSSTLSGELLYIVIIAVLDATILSWVALRWYRRAVERRMGVQHRGDAASSRSDTPELIEPSERAGSADDSLRVAVFRTDVSRRAPSRREWPAGWRRIALAYAVGAALFSAVVTAAATREFESPGFLQVFGIWWMNAWPIVPTLILLLVLDRRSALHVVAAYLLGGSAVLAVLTLLVQVARGSVDAAPVTNIFWLNLGLLVDAGPALVLVLISSWHRIRAVMPLALASTLFFGFGLLVFRRAAEQAFNTPGVQDVLLELAVLTSMQAAYYGIYMILALPVGWLAWRFLKALAATFERKRFSDIQLVVDCWWVIVTADTITTSLIAPFGLTGIAVGLAAFAAYRVGTFVTLRLMRNAPTATAKRLLLLRVFGYQSRTESLFDRVAQRWRFLGPVQLIAGVDLAMRTADPGDMLAFVGGRLREVYVMKPDDLPARFQRLDMKRDPDGRFRVNDVYCAHQTWQDALRQLLRVSDLVVMDLRGFTEEKLGCVYELQQLVTHLPPGAIVLVFDKTTDLSALARLLDEAWKRAGGSAQAHSSEPLALVQIDRDSPRELNMLMERLLGRGTPQEVLSVAALPTVS